MEASSLRGREGGEGSEARAFAFKGIILSEGRRGERMRCDGCVQVH